MNNDIAATEIRREQPAAADRYHPARLHALMRDRRLLRGDDAGYCVACDEYTGTGCGVTGRAQNGYETCEVPGGFRLQPARLKDAQEAEAMGPVLDWSLKAIGVRGIAHRVPAIVARKMVETKDR